MPISQLTIDCDSDKPILTIGDLARSARDHPGLSTTVCNLSWSPKDQSQLKTLTDFRRNISEIINSANHRSLNDALAQIKSPLLFRPVTIELSRPLRERTLPLVVDVEMTEEDEEAFRDDESQD